MVLRVFIENDFVAKLPTKHFILLQQYLVNLQNTSTKSNGYFVVKTILNARTDLQYVYIINMLNLLMVQF